ncbi:MAG: hypothetical protein ACQEQC_03495 [Elusimicrobiota bacterium]
MEIKTVNSKKDFKKFIHLPDKFYEGDENWVPDLDMDIKHTLTEENPFFEHAQKKLFIAYKDGVPVGRIAAVIDWNFVEFQEEHTGFFGFFECIDDFQVAEELFREAEKYLKKNKMNKVIGPMNPSSNDKCGMLIEGFDSPPRIMMSYNPDYYNGLLEKNNYSKAKDLVAMNMDVSGGPRGRLERIAKKIKKKYPQLRSRPINLKDFENEVKRVREIYNAAWEKNWGFVPWTKEEIEDLAQMLKPLVVEELLQIGFWKEQPVGFLLALPDYNEVIKRTGRSLFPFGWLKFLYYRNKINNLRLLAMGVKKEFQNKGVGPLMYYNSLVQAMKLGYEECEFSWILEDNEDTIKIGKMMGAKIYKKYRIYRKNLT